MVAIVSLFLSSVFLLLAVLHFYWASGGEWGLDAALPANAQGQRILNPKPIDCIVVGLGLLFFGFFYFSKCVEMPIDTPYWLDVYPAWGIAAIFLLRTIGDFRYVGFFKKVKNTHFARMDKQFFTPLCLVVGGVGLWLAYTIT